MFFAVIIDNLGDWGPRLLAGLRLTLGLTIASFGVALMLGLGIEFLRRRRFMPARLAAQGYVALARGIPILVILYLLYFAMPGAGVTLPADVAGTIGLALVYGAYLAEVLRAGLDAVPSGQREAAIASGLTPLQTFCLILLPQAARKMIAPLLINFVSLLKDSSICALIAVPELTLTSRELMSESFLPLHVFLVTGLFYFIVAWPASLAARAIERRIAQPAASRKADISQNALTQAAALR